MNYRDDGFRAFYHKFTILPITERIKAAFGSCRISGSDNGVLTYGYYDRTEGLTLLLLEPIYFEEGLMKYQSVADSRVDTIPIEEVADEEIILTVPSFSQAEEKLEYHYSEKLAMLQAFRVSAELEETRNAPNFDRFRDKKFIDRVTIKLLKAGYAAEDNGVQFTGIRDRIAYGELLQEPVQDFGCHIGDQVPVFTACDQNGNAICVCNVDAIPKLARNNLSDGKILESAIHEYNVDQSLEHLNTLFQILTDSSLWLCGKAMISEADERRIRRMAQGAGRDEKSYCQQAYASKSVKVVPAVLESDHGKYILAFSNEDEINQHFDPCNHLTSVQQGIMDILALGDMGTMNAAGIIINYFSEPFILERNMWEKLKKFKSRLVP